MATILRKKSEVSHRHYKVIQILGLSPTQKAVSVTRFDHVMGSKVQWAYLTRKYGVGSEWVSNKNEREYRT